MPDGDKQGVYTRIKILGVALFIPISLALGPVAGYFLGNFLVKRFSLPISVLFLCIILGFISSVFETTNIIKFLLRESKK